MQNTDNTWGRQVIETALQYANHEWTATDRNVLHDFDPDDVSVRELALEELLASGYEIYRKKIEGE